MNNEYSWYVAQDDNTKLWCVAKSFDTYSESGLPTGLKTIIDSEHKSEESARKRLNEIRWS